MEITLLSEKIEVVIVGAGQAGIAMSEHLTGHGIRHVVLERGRIAESWRSARWDSLVTNGPAWHDRFPGLEFPDASPDSFPHKEDVAAYFAEYARHIDAPVRTGVEVTEVVPLKGRRGYRVTTSEGVIDAAFVVSATGAFQRGLIPPIVPEGADVTQLHSSNYRNPQQLPEGGVLVVGAGSSGVQIADEIRRSGRDVFLSVGPHDRPPRSYRSRDFVWWLGVLDKWDAATPAAGTEHVTIAVSGARGGHTVDFRDLAASGITLVGRTRSFHNGTLSFADDLAANIRGGDENYLSLLREADAYVAQNGLDLPEEPDAHRLGPLPREVDDPVRELALSERGIRTIVWATGFVSDYGWLMAGRFDEKGRPEHRRGVSPQRGLYFLGLPWQSRRGSSFIWGVWHDAKFIADHIAIQRGYAAYHPAPADEPARLERPVNA